MKRFVTVFLLIFSTTGLFSCLALEYEEPYNAGSTPFTSFSGTITNWNEYLTSSGMYTTTSGLYVNLELVDENTSSVVSIADTCVVGSDGSFSLSLPSSVDSIYLIESISSCWAGIPVLPASGIYVLNTLNNRYNMKVNLYNSADTKLYEVICNYDMYDNGIITRKVELQYATAEFTIIGAGHIGTTKFYETGTDGTTFTEGWSWLLINSYDVGSSNEYQLSKKQRGLTDSLLFKNYSIS